MLIFILLFNKFLNLSQDITNSIRIIKKIYNPFKPKINSHCYFSIGFPLHLESNKFPGQFPLPKTIFQIKFPLRETIFDDLKLLRYLPKTCEELIHRSTPLRFSLIECVIPSKKSRSRMLTWQFAFRKHCWLPQGPFSPPFPRSLAAKKRPTVKKRKKKGKSGGRKGRGRPWIPWSGRFLKPREILTEQKPRGFLPLWAENFRPRFSDKNSPGQVKRIWRLNK